MPDRGPVLRDRYVLRRTRSTGPSTSSCSRALAVALFTFASHHSALQNDYNQIMNDLSGGDPGATSVRGFLGHLRNAFHYSPRHLIELGLLLTAYAALEASEMVGLWYAKRWAEYLTFIATVLLVPFELYELSNGVSVFKVLTLVINLAIVVYLLLAKRLFGLRGGHKVVIAERERLGGGRHRAGHPQGHRPGVGPRHGWYRRPHGPLAQLVAHLHDTQGVRGSSPLRPTRVTRSGGC